MEDSKTSLMFSDLERVRCETIFDVTALTPAWRCTLFDTDDWFRWFRIRFANTAGSGALALEPFSITFTVRLPFLTLVFRRQIRAFWAISIHTRHQKCKNRNRKDNWYFHFGHDRYYNKLLYIYIFIIIKLDFYWYKKFRAKNLQTNSFSLSFTYKLSKLSHQQCPLFSFSAFIRHLRLITFFSTSEGFVNKS